MQPFIRQINDLLNPLKNQEMNRYKTLKDPSKGWRRGGFTQLARNGLTLLDQSLSELSLAQVIDQ